MSWGETLQHQKSSLRWDIKRTMKSLCKRLADIGEECFVVTVNVNNGWVGHMGSIHGDDFLNENIHIPYNFLDYCRDSVEINEGPELKPPKKASHDSDKDDGAADDGKPISIDIMPPDSDTEEQEEAKQTTDYQQQQNNKEPKTQPIIIRQGPKLSPSKIRIRKPTVKLPDRRPIKHKLTLGPDYVQNGPFLGTAVLFSCKSCNQIFKHRSRYEVHLQTEIHKLNISRDFTCYKCRSQFGGIGDLYRHVKQCQGNKVGESLEQTEWSIDATCKPSKCTVSSVEDGQNVEQTGTERKYIKIEKDY